MRFVRILLTAAAFLLATACAAASANSAGVWVRVSPTTVTAGNQTQIQASCGENVNSATVSSTVFGSVKLQPVAGVLTTKVTVPPNTGKGTFDVRLTCPTGSTATTTLTVLAANVQGQAPPSARGPGTGGGFLAGSGEPADRTPFVWLGVGLSSLIAAAAVVLRRKGLLPLFRRGPRDDPAAPADERPASARR
jgi:hypothetical protein